MQMTVADVKLSKCQQMDVSDMHWFQALFFLPAPALAQSGHPHQERPCRTLLGLAAAIVGEEVLMRLPFSVVKLSKCRQMGVCDMSWF